MQKLTLDQIKEKVIPILKAQGVKRSSLFGSYVRGEQRNDSDIDILVEFPEGKTLYDLVDLEDKIKDVLHKDVDVVTYNSVSPHVKKYIFANLVQLL